MKIRLSFNNEISKKSLSWLSVFSLSIYIIAVGVNSFFNGLKINNQIDSAIIYGLHALLFLGSLPIIIKSIKNVHFLFFIIFCLFLLLSGLMNEGVTLSRIGSSILVCASGFFVGISLSDFKSVEKPMRWFSLISFVCAIFHVVFSTFRHSSVIAEDMTASYGFLPASIMLIYYVCEKPNIINLSLSISSLIILFLFATRGPIVIFLFFFLVFLIKYFKKMHVRIFFFSTIFLFLVSLRFFTYGAFLEWLNGIFLRNKINNWILTRINNGDLFNPSGRDMISNSVAEIIIQNPFGSGAFADRFYLGTYAHNFMLEILLDFGLFFGPLILILYFASIIGLLIKHKGDNAAFGFLMAVLSIAIGHLLFSGSYLESYPFFLMVGILFNQNLNKREVSLRRSTVEGGFNEKKYSCN